MILERLTAQWHEHEGRILCVIVGFDQAGEAVYTTTFTRESTRARWWRHEPEEYAD